MHFIRGSETRDSPDGRPARSIYISLRPTCGNRPRSHKACLCAQMNVPRAASEARPAAKGAPTILLHLLEKARGAGEHKGAHSIKTYSREGRLPRRLALLAPRVLSFD